MRYLLLLSLVICVQLNTFAYKLTPFIPQRNESGISIIVCPGGSYFWLDKDNEGYNVARWLNDNGITAFVLEYSHGGWASFAFHVRAKGRSFPAGYNDLCRALNHVRTNSARYGVDPNKIGFMGFSAGGHLVMHAAEQLAGMDSMSIQPPMFVAPIYPVVSMTHPCTHKRSRRGLVGEFPKKMMLDSLSIENHVTPNCPPVFLVNCKDDPIVNYKNSELLDSALSVYNIPHKYEQYSKGGHGFGVSAEKTSLEAIQWKERFLEWLNIIIKNRKQ